MPPAREKRRLDYIKLLMGRNYSLNFRKCVIFLKKYKIGLKLRNCLSRTTGLPSFPPSPYRHSRHPPTVLPAPYRHSRVSGNPHGTTV